jgi:glycerate 2-kinase
MKVLVSPGAFKGSLGALQAGECIVAGLQRSGLDADITLLPIADGGDGTLDVLLNAAPDGRMETVTVRDPLGRPVRAAYGIIDNGETAIIEMAQPSGLGLLTPRELDPLKASSYGTGQIMALALKQGARKFMIGLGGSATVDAGSGALLALGARFLDENGRPIMQQGGRILGKVASIDLSQIDSNWADCEVNILVDVDNLPTGERGAATVFGPQKGATPEQIPTLDAGIKNFLTHLEAASGRQVLNLKGGGAAGAIAASLAGALDGKLISGVDTILAFIGFDKAAQAADLVITGEGRMDDQTIDGKGPFGVALRAAELGVPTLALVGSISVDEAVLHHAGLAAVHPILDRPQPIEFAMRDAADLLERAALRLGYTLKLQQGNREQWH